MNKKGIILLLTFLLGGTSISACKCSRFSLDEEMERATSIFLGTYIEQQENKMVFHVIKLYKGNTTSNGQIQIIQSNSSCYKQRKFTLGEQLLFFAEKEGIHNCSRTKKVEFNSDFDVINKLNPNAKIYNQEEYNETIKRLNFLQELLRNCGLDNGSTLNKSEIDFLIPYLKSDKSKIEFKNKHILFVTGPSGRRITDKSSYFKSVKSYNSINKNISNSIFWLDDEMKIKSGGYDAIITYWVKVFSKRQLKKIVKKAKKQKSLPVTIDKK